MRIRQYTAATRLPILLQRQTRGLVHQPSERRVADISAAARRNIKGWSMDHDHYSDAYIAQILHSVRTIALVGASPNDIRPSNIVVKYLVAKGYRVFPINPGHAGKAIHGQTIYASLADVPEPIDMVEVFRGSAYMPAIVEEVLALKVRPKIVWAQLTVRHDEAARRAEAAGLKVVMNRCPKIEFGRLSGEIGWNGINSGVISAKMPVRGPGLQTLTIRPRG